MSKTSHFWHILSVGGFFGGAELIDVFRPDGPFGRWHYAPFVVAAAVYLVRVAAKYLGKPVPPSAPLALLLLTALCLCSCKSLGPTPPPGTPGFVNCSDAAIHQAALGLLPAVENALATDNWEAALLTIIAQDGGPLALAEVDCAVLWVESKAEDAQATTADSLEATKAAHAKAWLVKHPVTFQ